MWSPRLRQLARRRRQAADGESVQDPLTIAKPENSPCLPFTQNLLLGFGLDSNALVLRGVRDKSVFSFFQILCASPHSKANYPSETSGNNPSDLARE